MATANVTRKTRSARQTKSVETPSAEPISRDDPLYERVIATLVAQSSTPREQNKEGNLLRLRGDDLRRVQSLAEEVCISLSSIERLAHKAGGETEVCEIEPFLLSIQWTAKALTLKCDQLSALLGDSGVGVYRDEFREEPRRKLVNG